METATPAIPKSLFVFSIFYGGMVCIAGVLGNKLVGLGPLSDLGPALGLGPLGIEAGICAFLLLVIVSSAIAELHGGAVATRLVRWGFVPLIATMALIELVLALPPAAAMEPARLAAFETILGQSARLMLAGLIAYGTSQTLNVTIFAALKGREGSQLLWLRAGIASVLSQIVDTLLFITISFYGVFPIGGLLIGQMIVKVLLSAVLVPPLVYLFVAIGRKLDGTATPA
ncbi:queuosine precursor transporter [Sphingomonas crusticola]|uniref:queuosine precursor transporter n=1 Tax=Sphingomonas crusticola TaxID=1697973 RepID=UPI000E2594E4|nr:queuosine precursor transporter [Sphingomonas crusticola]